MQEPDNCPFCNADLTREDSVRVFLRPEGLTYDGDPDRYDGTGKLVSFQAHEDAGLHYGIKCEACDEYFG